MSPGLPSSLRETIAGWLPRARWFAAKGGRVDRIEIADAAHLPTGGLAIALVDVQVGGEPARYVVPVDAATGADAACATGFADWLVTTALAGGTLDGAAGRFVGHSSGPPACVPGRLHEVVPLGSDASNTSCRATGFAVDVAVKLLRRCRAGIQPEVEMGDFFAVHAAWSGTPRLRGWLEYVPAAGPDAATAIATVHDFAPGCTSVWELLVDAFRAGGLTGPRRGDILAIVDRLGRTTGEMHAALASRPDLPAFAALRPTAVDRRRAAAAMVEHATAVLARVETAAAALPAALAHRLHAVAARRDELLGRLGGGADIDDGATWIRTHGDYHLGQVLVGRGDAATDRMLVIDFEGEPGRSLDERRRKTTACRDVAGMMRSFDYLLRHVARSGGPPHRPADLSLLEQRFLGGYEPLAAGQPWWPGAADAAARLLSIAAVDKAIYELAYELANRPDWVEVPLAAIEASQPPARALPNDRSGRPS